MQIQRLANTENTEYCKTWVSYRGSAEFSFFHIYVVLASDTTSTEHSAAASRYKTIRVGICYAHSCTVVKLYGRQGPRGAFNSFAVVTYGYLG